jgi:hypothetical protein
LFVLVDLARPPATVFAHEISGFATGEARIFPNKTLFPGQSDQSASFACNLSITMSSKAVAVSPSFRFCVSIAEIRNAPILTYANSPIFGCKRIMN